MDQLTHECTSDAKYLIVPKEEMLDDLVILDQSEDDRDGVKPKEEPSDTSLPQDDELNEPNVGMVMPIKTELILSENIAYLRRQYESAEHGSVSDKDVCPVKIEVDIKTEPESEAGVDVECTRAENALLQKKCTQRHRSQATQKHKFPSCNVRSDSVLHMNTHAGDKPYTCGLCQKYFAANGYLCYKCSMMKSRLEAHFNT